MSRTPSPLFAVSALALAAAVLAGCPNVATLTTASNIGEGTFELTAAPGVSGISWGFLDAADFDGDGQEDDVEVDSGYLIAPTVDLAARYGITDRFEMGFGFRNWFSMVEFDVKATLLDNDSMALAVKPGVGVGWGVYWAAELPLLVDFKLDERVTLALAAKYAPFFINSAATGVDSVQHFAGGNISVEFKISDTFYLQPNFGMLAWLNADDQFEGTSSDFRHLLYSGGVALKFRL